MGQFGTPARDHLQPFVRHSASVVQHDPFHLRTGTVPCLATETPEDRLERLVPDYVFAWAIKIVYLNV